MSETIDLGKEKNVVESRVTEFRGGASLSLGRGEVLCLGDAFAHVRFAE